MNTTPMTLKTLAECVSINKTSTSPAFDNMIIGDIIVFETEMKSPGKRGSCYLKPHIRCHNMRTGKDSYITFANIERELNKFCWREFKLGVVKPGQKEKLRRYDPVK